MRNVVSQKGTDVSDVSDVDYFSTLPAAQETKIFIRRGTRKSWHQQVPWLTLSRPHPSSSRSCYYLARVGVFLPRPCFLWAFGYQYGVQWRVSSAVCIIYIVINSQVLFHNGSLLHSQFNTQLLITVHNSSRNLTQLWQILELQRIRLPSSSFSTLIQITNYNQ
jgi:hypothetical protein